ncbi:dual specificity mitogen-activated protein kinase kinase 2 isoform X1 [Octopus bimaculoides]|uniref:mitogen-activated protein kinase kinase n=2 Tax=Octopus bimaculoides TaxID=37653 RepID=A0A0L8GNB7_OCTBM|nr:dual specificity mitogen-activated protein kinase kinase 2 isoform X1 [Octopus bimaculoides]|eukprot:XP_014779560.1 PREDICTED: dual specificity mitogen-activated protein kinase kinase 2-like [Octopus bimaculoides]
MRRRMDPEIRRSLEGLSPVTNIELDGKEVTCRVDELKQLSVLGNGSFGVVFEMQHVPTQKIMAVKKIKFVTSDKDKMKRLVRDLEISKKVDSEYTVRCLGTLFSEGDVWILMEKKDLCLEQFYQYVINSTDIPEAFLAKTTLIVVKALQYLRKELKIMHKDVKPSNILLEKNGGVCVCDFGVSGPLDDSFAKSMNAGCKAYMAPELIDPDLSPVQNDVRSDVWSLGITLIEVGNGKYPYTITSNPFDFVKEIVEGDPPKLTPGKYSKNFEMFTAFCLTKEVEKRPKYEGLLDHIFLQNAEKDDFNMSEYLSPLIEKYLLKT